MIDIIEGFLIPESSHVNPAVKWRKNALRASVVLASAVVAYLGFDTLDNFVALIGAFCSVPLAIIYPVLMHTALARADAAAAAKGPAAARAASAPPLSMADWVANVAVGVLGVGIGALASAFAIWTWPR